MRAVVHAVEEDLGARAMGQRRGGGDVDDGAERVRGDGAGDEPGPRRKQRSEIVDVQPSIVPHAPEDDACADRLERHPGRDIGVVVEVAHDDLVACAEIVPDAEADEADEAGRVEPERHLVRIAGVEKVGHRGAGRSDARVHRHALAVSPATLDVMVDKMVVDRIEDGLWHLGAGGIVEEDEVGIVGEGGKAAACVCETRDGRVGDRRLVDRHWSLLDNSFKPKGTEGAVNPLQVDAAARANSTRHRRSRSPATANRPAHKPIQTPAACS